MTSKPTTSFADNVEEIPLESFNEDDADGERNGILRRSSTDAHLSNYRPQSRVRFHTLAGGIEKQMSHEEFDLLSTKAHQIGHANWEGGWQNTVFRKRRGGWSPRSEEEEVQEIAQAMEEDQKIMADDVDGEMHRRDALRELTKSLKVKKAIRARLTLTRSTVRRISTRKISCFKSLQYSLSMKWFRFKDGIKTAIHDYSLWHKDIKAVEGMYGTSVGSYFHFLKYLFLLNSFVSMAVIGFLLIPQILQDKRTENSEEISLVLPTDLRSATPSGVFLYDHESTTRTYTPYVQDTQNNSRSFGPIDWLTGAGWFRDTALYYGGYSTGPILTSTASNSTAPYDMTVAYFFTVTSCFTLYIIILLYKIFDMYRVNFIDTEADVNITFVEKVFSAWDHNITDEKSASIKKRNVYNELIELLQEYQEEEEIESWMERFSRRCIQVFAWFILVSFLILLGWGLYVLLKDKLHNLSGEETAYWSQSFGVLVYPIIVTLLMGLVPIIFEGITRLEKYRKPRYELYANLIRVFILETVILVALVLFWYERSPGLEDELKPSKIKVTSESALTMQQEGNETLVQCWESALGEEIYRLVILDFLFIAFSTLVIDGIKAVLVKKERANDNILEFCLPRNTVHIIYNQTLLWAGMFFCPLIPLIISLKFLLIFYLQKFTVTRNLRPIDRPWRAGQTQTLFYALTLLSLILAYFSYGFIVVRGYSSPSCGSFQGYTHYIDVVWEISGASERLMIQIFTFLLRPGFIFFMIIVVALVVYCVKNLSEGRAQLVDILKCQLELEMKDRVFLQRLIERVQKGQYPPHPLHAGNRTRSVSSNPDFLIHDMESKHLTKRSSFVFSRKSSEGNALSGTQL